MNKIYAISYHEVQIAGYRVFTNFETAIKEYLKHCITETKNMLESPEPSEEGESSEEESLDDMTCVLEVMELQDEEFVTTKEWDYETFQIIIEDIENIPEYLDELSEQLDANKIPEDLMEIFEM